MTWDEFLTGLPAPLRQAAKGLERTRSKQDLERFIGVLSGVPNLRVWMKLLKTVGTAFTPCRVAFVGPVNSGKSFLFNALAGENLAKVHPVPGTTREVQIEKVGGFTLADTPGVDAAGGDEERQKALDEAGRQYLNVLVFDATVGITASCKGIFDEIRALGVPYLVVLNKIDRVSKQERPAVLADAAEKLKLESPEILAVSATKRYGLDGLVSRIVIGHPDLSVALGPMGTARMRTDVARNVVVGASGTAAMIALAPIPFADIAPLTALQVGVIVSVARVYGQELDRAAAQALLSSLGAGFGLREVARAGVKLVPQVGPFLSAAIAAAGTLALGLAAIWHFSTDSDMPQERQRGVYARTKARLWRVLRRSDESVGDAEEVLEDEAAQSAPDAEGEGQQA